MIYTKSDVYREMKRYFEEEVKGNNDDIVASVSKDLDNVFSQNNILRSCKIINDTFVNIHHQNGKLVYKDKKFLPLWIRYLVYVVIYQYFENNKEPLYAQETLLKEMGLYPDIFGKKNWCMYSPEMKIHQSKYESLKLPFNHSEIV